MKKCASKLRCRRWPTTLRLSASLMIPKDPCAIEPSHPVTLQTAFVYRFTARRAQRAAVVIRTSAAETAFVR